MSDDGEERVFVRTDAVPIVVPRLLEEYAEGDPFAGKWIREAGGWSEDRPPDTTSGP